MGELLANYGRTMGEPMGEPMGKLPSLGFRTFAHVWKERTNQCFVSSSSVTHENLAGEVRP